MSNSWYPRYYGDYMRDTAHLTLTEHGVYTVLLDHYYATGAALPDDPQALIRVCRAYEDAERQAVLKIAADFFPVNGDGKRHNKRADRELATIAGKSIKAKTSADARWHPERNADDMRTQCERISEGNANHNHNHNHIQNPDAQPEPENVEHVFNGCSTGVEQQPIKAPLKGTNKGALPVAFESFWTAYPKKTGKKAALKAWQAANDKPELAQLIAAVQKQAQSEQWRKDGGQFIPNPATWLNQGRWDDIPATTAQRPRNFI